MFKRFWWVFLVGLILGPLAGVFVGGVIAYVSPKTYDSTTVLQVRPTAPSVQVLPDHPPAPTSSNFIATEVEVIRAQTTLDLVIYRLDLTTRWDLPRAEVLARLRQAIEVRNIEGTDLIEIRVRTTNPQDSKLIAETASDAYSNRRRELGSQRSDRALDELREAVREQKDLVEEKRKVLTQLIRHGPLIYPNGTYTQNRQALDAAQKYAELESERIKLESQIDTLLRYDDEQLFTYAAGLNLPENIIDTLHPQWLEAKRQLEAARKAGLGGDHPTVKQQTQIIEQLSRDMDEGTVALRETLRAQLELVKEQAERLRLRKEEEGVTLLGQSPSRYTFDDARQDFETAQDMLEKLKVKLITEKMQRRISEDPVVVHANPVEAMTPASPNIALHLLFGAVGGLLLGLIAPFGLIPIVHAIRD